MFSVELVPCVSAQEAEATALRVWTNQEADPIGLQFMHMQGQMRRARGRGCGAARWRASVSGSALRTRLCVFGDLALAILLILGGTFDFLLRGVAGFEIARGERCLEKLAGQSFSFRTGHDWALELEAVSRIVWVRHAAGRARVPSGRRMS